MAYNARNIIVGAASLYLSAVEGGNTALPASPGAGSSFATALEASAAWRHAGYTSEGLELAYEPDWTDIEVDQLLDSAKIFKTSMRATINTTIVESTLENLLVAWGQTSATLASTASDSTIGIAAGALGDEPVERSLAAVGLDSLNSKCSGVSQLTHVAASNRICFRHHRRVGRQLLLQRSQLSI